jgi:GDP-L-fucose synthase
MNKGAKIYIAEHRGLVGSAILRQLKKERYENIITRSHQELDLIRQADVEEFFAEEKAGVCLFGSSESWRNPCQ